MGITRYESLRIMGLEEGKVQARECRNAKPFRLLFTKASRFLFVSIFACIVHPVVL